MDGSSAYRRILRNRALVRLLVGETISAIGDWLYLVAILVVVYQVTTDPVILGLVGAARLLPFVLLSVPAGIAADRFDRRSILLVSDVGRAVLMVMLAGLVMGEAPVSLIVAVAIAAACFGAFFGPAIGAYLPVVVGNERDLGTANSVWATLDNLAYFVGPAVAGLLIAAGGLSVAFLLNAVSFAIAAVILLTLPRGRPSPAAPPRAVDAGSTDGPLPISRSALLRRVAAPVIVDAASNFVWLGTSILLVIVAVDQLDAGPAAVGYLEAATGVGGVVAGLLAGWFVGRRLDVPLVVGALVGGIGLSILAATTSLGVALVVVGVAVGAIVVMDIVVVTLVQRQVPDHLRGRAMGVLQLTGVGAAVAGSMLAPVLAGRFGLLPVFVGMGVSLLLAALVAVGILGRQGALAARTDIDPVRISLLRRTILAGAPAGLLESAATDMADLTVSAGEVVIRQGDEADRFYIIVEGRFGITQTGPDGTQVAIRELGPADPFGEIGLLTGSGRTATVTALTDARLLMLERDAFLALVRAGPDLGEGLMTMYRSSPDRG